MRTTNQTSIIVSSATAISTTQRVFLILQQLSLITKAYILSAERVRKPLLLLGFININNLPRLPHGAERCARQRRGVSLTGQERVQQQTTCALSERLRTPQIVLEWMPRAHHRGILFSCWGYIDRVVFNNEVIKEIKTVLQNFFSIFFQSLGSVLNRSISSCIVGHRSSFFFGFILLSFILSILFLVFCI